MKNYVFFCIALQLINDANKSKLRSIMENPLYGSEFSKGCPYAKWRMEPKPLLLRVAESHVCDGRIHQQIMCVTDSIKGVTIHDVVAQRCCL